MEPSPRALSIVPWLVSNFGWPHSEAGKKYIENEQSFRQTLSWHNRTARSFDLDIEEKNKRITVNFDYNSISPKFSQWKEILKKRGMAFIPDEYIPYWGFNDVFHKAGIKLKNCFFIIMEEKKEKNSKLARIDKFYILSNFSLEKLLKAIEAREVYIDFDARTGHNHGTKFRCKTEVFPKLYEKIELFSGLSHK